MHDVRAAINAYSRREPELVTRARRFCRRAAAHGIAITLPVVFRKTDAVVRLQFCAAQIFPDGSCVPYLDVPAHHARAHAYKLKAASRFRRRGQYDLARILLGYCAQDRQLG